MTTLLSTAMYVGTLWALGCPCKSGGSPPAVSSWGYGYTGGGYTADGYWTPGGYEPRVGSPYYYSTPWWHYGTYSGDGSNAAGPQYSARAGYAGTSSGGADPYEYHFGPGYYRQSEYGHYRFPYYSYRRPWYFPGPTSYNRDTNLPW